MNTKQNEIRAALAEILELPRDSHPQTGIEVDSLASLSIQAAAAERWNAQLDPVRLEQMGTLEEIAAYLECQANAALA